MLPPHTRLLNFLPLILLDELLRWTLEHEDAFTPARTTSGLMPTRRLSLVTRELGPLRTVLEAQLREALPSIFAAMRLSPFEPDSLELELAAHGDGAFFEPHLDIPIGPGRKPLGGDGSAPQDRVLSAVLYFYRRPKAFTGGALRLRQFGSTEEDGLWIDVEPEQNSLLVFPSWMTHEVRRVSCPSQAFGDYRFAVNCWYCRNA